MDPHDGQDGLVIFHDVKKSDVPPLVPTPQSYSLSAIDHDEKTLLTNKLGEVKAKRDKHDESYQYWRRVDLYVGFICTLISAIVTSTLGIQLTLSEISHVLNIVQLSFSTFGFILSAAHKYFNVTQRTQNHFASFRSYSELSNSVHLRLVKNNLLKKDVLDMLHDMTDAMQILTLYAADN